MLTIWSVSAIAFVYLAVLFAIAYFSEKYKVQSFKSLVYGLTLAVYCTSWSFYGTTAQAANNGWWLAPTYVGSLLLFIFGWQVYLKISEICQTHKITSISDFIATRYGQSSSLASIITTISVFAIIPYISLQLSAISQSTQLIAGNSTEATQSIFQDGTFYITLVLAVFAILFGANKLRPNAHNLGLMNSIAFESLLKLFAFLAIGLYVCFGLFESPSELMQAAKSAELQSQVAERGSANYVYISHMILGLLAMLCLPRQFHVSFVERDDKTDIKKARWIFPLYLLLLNICTLPIGYAGLLLLDQQSVAFDTFVLALPLAFDNQGLALTAYLGGFSAAISMVILSAIVLSVMITNDIINPLLLTKSKAKNTQSGLSPEGILLARKAVILGVLIASYFCHKLLSGTNSLANVGLMSFTLVAQFAPALLLGLVWRSASRKAAKYAILTGFSVWAYSLLLPSIATSLNWQSPWLQFGPFGLGFLAPADLLGLGLDSISQTLLLSLTFNTLVFVYISLKRGAEVAEQLQAEKFVFSVEQHHANNTKHQLSVDELSRLLLRFVDETTGQQIIQHYFPERGAAWLKPSDAKLEAVVAREMAAVIGGASANLILTAAKNKQHGQLSEVATIVDEASQVLKFNRDLLQSTIENVNQGISVVDGDLNLVAWNSVYQTMFNYPENALYIGRPIADIIRFNAERGLFKADDIESEIAKRLAFLKTGSAYKYQRDHQNGRVFEMQGNPLPSGGFVTTFSDVTEFVNTQDALKEANTNLEQKVNERTHALTQANSELAQATESKTRFFAAASHDLLQPFNAASLFCSVMEEKSQGTELSELASNIKNSLTSAEELLSSILELTKLESGSLKIEKSEFSIAKLLTPLSAEFSALASEKGLSFIAQFDDVIVSSDRTLLRRVVQNLLSNAVRYTQSGEVTLCAKKAGEHLELSVKDTGPGIASEDQTLIFQEFKQLDGQDKAQGLGLGLAITKRISDALNLDLRLQSNIGQGAQFSIRLPIAAAGSQSQELALNPINSEQAASFVGLTVWLIDNDETVLQALAKRLQTWGCDVQTATNEAQLMALKETKLLPMLIIADYHLDDGATGVELLDKCGLSHVPCIINTAEHDESVRELISDAGYPLLYKPVKAPALKRLIKKLCA
ncbi:PAS domain-containing hybrid sensor histidine kinase/response regulator [Pseudoalteromonas sp. SSM20]|uniref:PAS domain-containing hybrid sensor histidine kinase/response regulator n=1 Tax=Pseudoalteromonas sp. SSM20 TaxID=3139394 RepID=UPI003BACEE9E